MVRKGVATEFSKCQGNRVLAGRNKRALDRTADECLTSGAEVLVVATDVMDTKAVEQLATATIRRKKDVHVWVNNDGVAAAGEFDQMHIVASANVIK